MIVIILINAVTLHNHSVHTPQLPKNNNILCLRKVLVLEWFVGRGVGPEYKEPGRSNWEMPPSLLVFHSVSEAEAAVTFTTRVTTSLPQPPEAYLSYN